ncbi:hypothetical protein P5G51_018610 [Virgibacillus sp. 179-BFC.A HS]|uniref:Uncharacterized protein n=1 Tax=Tigheibacillus jepli TaxID=3035914 RepID=A0ABU5CLH6_9BACI|nr:hypothetical protein [Virgibacillus sp. 179-BFC.A HS]MDY0407075.1 hypothetical protein [Virgibacillus sp. 179-BFC.A HS]
MNKDRSLLTVDVIIQEIDHRLQVLDSKTARSLNQHHDLMINGRKTELENLKYWIEARQNIGI